MWIRKYLFILMLVMLPTSFFCFKNYIKYQKRIEYKNEYKKVKVKVDSFGYGSTRARQGKAIKIYYSYDGVQKMIRISEDSSSGYYRHFGASNRDSLYVWYNSNADSLYATKDSKPLNFDKYKKKMYFNLFLVIITVFLVMWFIYITYTFLNKNEEE